MRFYTIKPMVIDGEPTFVPVDDPELAQQAADIFTAQWDYVHGWVDASALAELPEFFKGRRVVRDPVVLDELARVGAFDMEEIYRELYG